MQLVLRASQHAFLSFVRSYVFGLNLRGLCPFQPTSDLKQSRLLPCIMNNKTLLVWQVLFRSVRTTHSSRGESSNSFHPVRTIIIVQSFYCRSTLLFQHGTWKKWPSLKRLRNEFMSWANLKILPFVWWFNTEVSNLRPVGRMWPSQPFYAACHVI
jgi:hypothetical protein